MFFIFKSLVNTYSSISSVLYCAVGRVALNPLFYKNSSIAYNHFFKFCLTPRPCSLQLPPPLLIVVLFLCLNGWSHHIWCAILLNDTIDVHMWQQSIKFHSVHWGINNPPSKTLPFFLPSHTLNLYWFFMNLPLKVESFFSFQNLFTC